MIDPAGNIVEYELDGNDNVTKITERLLGSADSHMTDAEYITTSTYDSLNRVVETIDKLGHKTSFEYDLRNNLKAAMDGTNNVRSYTYDALNRRTKSRTVTTGGDITVDMAYDGNSRMSTYKDAKGSTTTYGYDAINRTSSITYPKGGEVQITYDGNDNIATTIDRNGTRVDYIYDTNNRLIRKDIAPGAGVIGTTTENFEYDALNRMTLAANNDATVQFTYDSRSLIWRDTQNDGTTELRFDEVGNKIGVVYPNQSVVLQRAYDELDRLRRIGATTPADILSREYLGQVRPTDEIRGNGLSSQYNYDSEGKLFDIIHGSGNSIAGFEYAWDNAHYRTKEVKRHLADAEDTYSYDGAHRITAANVHLGDTVTRPRSFTYDATDNLTAKTLDGPPQSFTTNAEHQYTASDQGEQFGYDANGNLTSYSSATVSKTFAYDYLNRLMRAEITESGTTRVVTFAYDALGRRIRKQSGSDITRYVYEGAQVVQELDGAGAIRREYIWGDTIDELQAIRQNGQPYFVHKNSIGSVAAITDSTGAWVERFDYDVFGLPTVTYNNGTPVDPRVSSLGQPYSFQGREYDPETGLFYFRARYYSAELGRFISQDPEMFVDGPNLYAGFLNSPTNVTDPLGTDGGMGAETPQAVETRRAIEQHCKDKPEDCRWTWDDTSETGSMVFSSLPVGGEISDAVGCFAGYDPITSKELSRFQRGVSCVATVAPFVGGAVIRKIIGAGGDEVVESVVKNADEVPIANARFSVGTEGVVRETKPLAQPGEDLFVGPYKDASKGNRATGLKDTHTPHHSAADAITPVKTRKGVTINLQKRLHELTRTYKRNPVRGRKFDIPEQLHQDVEDIRRILINEGYDFDDVERALNELVRQNYEQYKLYKGTQ